MSDDYKKWEEECERIRQENKGLLEEFKKYLTESGLGKKTVTSHYQNVDFYINDYLLYTDDLVEAKDGATEIDGFLSDWFVRKAAWSSKAHIKANAASLKKFYTFLFQKGMTSKEDLAELKATIKEDMEDWLDGVGEYGSW